MASSSTRVFGRACGALMAAVKTPSSTSASAAAAAKTTPAAAKATSTAKPKKAPAAKRSAAPPAGITKPVPISLALQQFLGGVPEASRTGAVKEIWNYIKTNNLQNPANKREIFCDAKLKTIFDGKDQVGFTEVAKLLSQHFVKA